MPLRPAAEGAAWTRWGCRGVAALHAALEVVEALVAKGAAAVPAEGVVLLLLLRVGVVHVLAAIVPPPGLLVSKHLVRARDLFEVGLRLLLVLVLVRVPLLGELMVRLLHLSGAGAPRQPEHLIVVDLALVLDAALELLHLLVQLPMPRVPPLRGIRSCSAAWSSELSTRASARRKRASRSSGSAS